MGYKTEPKAYFWYRIILQPTDLVYILLHYTILPYYTRNRNYGAKTFHQEHGL